MSGISFHHIEDPDDPRVAHQSIINDLVERLVELDHAARVCVYEQDMDKGSEVSMEVTEKIAQMTWGITPTVIMHMAHHINLARAEAGVALQACTKVGETLKAISAEMARQGVPVNVCASLMDLGVTLLDVVEASSLESEDVADDA